MFCSEVIPRGAFLGAFAAAFTALLCATGAGCSDDTITSGSTDTGGGTISTGSSTGAIAGVKTFVIGFGSGADPATLSQFADAGGVPEPTTHF